LQQYESSPQTHASHAPSLGQPLVPDCERQHGSAGFGVLVGIGGTGVSGGVSVGVGVGVSVGVSV
jgi:hypothetical protein